MWGKKKLLKKLEEQLTNEMCGCDCGMDHCFDEGMLTAIYIIKFYGK